MTDPGAVHAALLERGQTVGCAESLTGGGLAALLSATPGASATFAGGVVTYATELKRRLLGVTAAEIISGECAVQMAVGARELLEVDWALSTTGVAGPDLQEGQPAGTVFVGLAGGGTARFVRLALDGDRDAVRSGACAGALDLLLAEVGRG
jgi:nicotinamide-nucleotide amidase